MDILTAIIQILVGGITGIATGVGGGLNSLVKEIFLETVTGETGSTTTLSTFGTLIIVFAGISLAIGLSKLVVHWLTSLGASRSM